MVVRYQLQRRDDIMSKIQLKKGMVAYAYEWLQEEERLAKYTVRLVKRTHVYRDFEFWDVDIQQTDGSWLGAYELFTQNLKVFTNRDTLSYVERQYQEQFQKEVKGV
jgi:hypothetical protein